MLKNLQDKIIKKKLMNSRNRKTRETIPINKLKKSIKSSNN